MSAGSHTGQGVTLAVVAIGGGCGATGRYGLESVLPTLDGQFPLATFLANVVGCFLLGCVMVVTTEVHADRRMVRLFLGVGVLGGFTTFSTYALEVHELAKPATAGVAVGYLIGTVVSALVAVVAGVWLTRRLTGAHSTVAIAGAEGSIRRSR